jgi:hypothetical protein
MLRNLISLAVIFTPGDRNCHYGVTVVTTFQLGHTNVHLPSRFGLAMNTPPGARADFSKTGTKLKGSPRQQDTNKKAKKSARSKGPVDKAQAAQYRAKRSKRRAARFVKSRTTRVAGQERWLREIFTLQRCLDDDNGTKQTFDPAQTLEASCVADTIEPVLKIAKELLYSGIPEQVLELYAAYHDLIVLPQVCAGGNNASIASTTGSSTSNSSTTDSSRTEELMVVPDLRLVGVALRAFLALDDLDGALGLLQSVARAGTYMSSELADLDTDSTSALIADLASHSLAGLDASLKLYR